MCMGSCDVCPCPCIVQYRVYVWFPCRSSTQWIHTRGHGHIAAEMSEFRAIFSRIRSRSLADCVCACACMYMCVCTTCLQALVCGVFVRAQRRHTADETQTDRIDDSIESQKDQMREWRVGEERFGVLKSIFLP